MSTSHLAAILHGILAELELAVTEPGHPYRFPALATFGRGEAAVRIVVLREVLIAHRLLVFYSDARSQKIAQLRINPGASWLFYDPRSRVQVRIRSHAQLHQQNAITQEAWDRTPVTGRQDYLAITAPGNPLHNAPVYNEGPSQEDDEAGLRNLIVVHTFVTEIDWLHLLPTGHLRARFHWSAANDWSSTWLQP